MFDQLSEPVGLNPVRRYISRDLPQLEQIKTLDSAQPRFERLPSAYLVVNTFADVHPASCAVRETSFFGIETIAEVDEVGAVVSL